MCARAHAEVSFGCSVRTTHRSRPS